MSQPRPRPVAPGSQSPRAGMFKSKKRADMLRQGASEAMALSARAKAAGGGTHNARKD